MALLHVLSQLAPKLGVVVRACGVNHGLRPAAAGELVLAERFAADLGVPFSKVEIELSPGSNLMARARDARYAALRRVLEAWCEREPIRPGAGRSSRPWRPTTAEHDGRHGASRRRSRGDGAHPSASWIGSRRARCTRAARTDAHPTTGPRPARRHHGAHRAPPGALRQRPIEPGFPLPAHARAQRSPTLAHPAISANCRASVRPGRRCGRARSTS